MTTGSTLVATIRGRLVAIGLEHKRRKLLVPTTDEMVREVFKGIGRIRGVKQTKKKPLYAHDVKTLLGVLPDTPRGWRDRALVLLGYSGAFRRAELASLQVDWIKRVAGGLEITLPTSKVDQAGTGTMIIIEVGSDSATCPVAVLQRYFHEARIQQGAVFRKIDRHGNVGTHALEGKAVASIVQNHVKNLLSYDATGYGAHSLRAGFATMLDEQGVGLTQIMQRGRWKSERIARGYLRSEEWRNPVNKKLGL